MKVLKFTLFIALFAFLIFIVVQFTKSDYDNGQATLPALDSLREAPQSGSTTIEIKPTNSPAPITNDSEKENVSNSADDLQNQEEGEQNIPVIADVDAVSVIVNSAHMLPENYEPTDLMYPDVRFVFEEKIEKRMLRQVAADALEDLFEAAEEDGMYLAGVSGYRSHATQKALFNRYVERDGFEKARTYSAIPGTSEHETGLAIDVTTSDGKCAAEDCFGDTKEAAWLADHAHEFGFIIRYPEGKESITGYKYEPWHLRYVGVELAQQITTEGLTLEEYYDTLPVFQD